MVYQYVKKGIFWLALALIGFIFIFEILISFTKLEFASEDYKDGYNVFLFFATPITILLTLFGTLKPKDKLVILKVFTTTAIAAFIGFLVFVSIILDMCVLSNDKILFEHKTDPDVKIIVQSFGCGATDSTPSSKSVVKVEYYTKYFIYVSPIDTSLISKNDWIKVSDE